MARWRVFNQASGAPDPRIIYEISRVRWPARDELVMIRRAYIKRRPPDRRSTPVVVAVRWLGRVVLVVVVVVVGR